MVPIALADTPIGSLALRNTVEMLLFATDPGYTGDLFQGAFSLQSLQQGDGQGVVAGRAPAGASCMAVPAQDTTAPLLALKVYSSS